MLQFSKDEKILFATKLEVILAVFNFVNLFLLDNETVFIVTFFYYAACKFTE